MLSRRAIRLAAAGLGALAISVPGLGCGSGSSDSASGSTTAVEAFDFGFRPDGGTVKAGDTVTWTNTGQTTHNVKGPGFFSKALGPGQSYAFKFRRPGTFKYLCTLHPTLMRASITVAR